MMRVANATRRLCAGVAVAVLAMTFLAGCDSFLEKEPLGELTTANFFQSREDALRATNATYNILRGFSVHAFPFLGMTEIVSDHATKGSTPGDASFLLEFENLEWDASQQSFRGTWEAYYQGIYRANVAITNIPDIDMDESLRARLIGENKFLRAYFYFFLIRAYGSSEANLGVPLITEPIDVGDEFQLPRASFDEIYNLIEQDLTDAIATLPEQSEYSASELGRATKGAARGFLAKAHLFQKDYPNALQFAEEVINSGEYSLHPDYSFIFTVEGEFSSGSIFEVVQIELEEGGGSSRYAQVQGVRGFPSLGWGFNQPSDFLETLYEPGDPRQQATILYPWEIVEEGSDLVVHINPNMTNQQYNEKVQVPLSTVNSGENPVNIRRLRYADVLLIAAEAAAQTGDAARAQDFLNQVRQRARGDQEATIGIIPEQLNEQLATENLGLGAGASRVFARYVNDGGPADGQVRPAESACIPTETPCSPPARNPGDPVPAMFPVIDVIQSVNGTSVSTLDDYMGVMESLSSGQEVSVQVLQISQQASGSEVSTSSETSQFDLTAVAHLPDVTATGQELLEAIWEERGVELAMEQHRWFDIIHQGRAEEIMTAAGKNWQDRFVTYPVPQSEIDLSGGALEQNPGY